MTRPCKLCGKIVDFSEPWCDHETMEESAWLDIHDRRVRQVAQMAIDEKQAPLSPKEVEDLALQIVIDEAVEESAKELGWHAGLAIKEQFKNTFDD